MPIKGRCGTRPIVGLPDDKNPICCGKCKTDGMIDINSKRCPCGSGHQPIYGLPTDKTPTCCGKCGTDGMINFKKIKCVRVELEQILD